MNSKKELAGHVATMAGEILELAPHRPPRDASFRSDTALARRPSRTCLFFDSHAVYASPPWHAMGINPLFFGSKHGGPRPAAKGHCSAAGPLVLIPKLGLHRCPALNLYLSPSRDALGRAANYRSTPGTDRGRIRCQTLTHWPSRVEL